MVKVRNLSTTWDFKLNLWGLILILFNQFKTYKVAQFLVWFGLVGLVGFTSMVRFHGIDLNGIYSTYCFDCKYRSVSVQSVTGRLLNLDPYKSRWENFVPFRIL